MQYHYILAFELKGVTSPDGDREDLSFTPPTRKSFTSRMAAWPGRSSFVLLVSSSRATGISDCSKLNRTHLGYLQKSCPIMIVASSKSFSALAVSRVAFCKVSLQLAKRATSEEVRKMALANALKAYEDIQNFSKIDRLPTGILIFLRLEGTPRWLLM
jgi:hypothetical protein